MHRYLLLALLAGYALPASAQDWTAIDLGTTATLRAIEQGSSSIRYLVGDGGYAALSDPTLTVWMPEDVSTTADLLSVIPAAGLKWISGSSGVVRVRDAGGTWNVRDVPDTTQAFALISRGNGEVLAAGSGGAIWKAADGGVSWALQDSGTTTALHGGFSQTAGDGYVVGDGGLVLKTTDGGTTWVPLPSGTTEHLYAIQQGGVVAGGARIVAVGANGTILTSDDDGATWTLRESGTATTLRALSRSGQSANGHLAVGDGGTVLRSTDNGETWCSLTTGTTTDFYAGLFSTGTLHLVAGADGVLLRTETGGGTCVVVANEPEAPPVGFALSAVRPNPARDAAALTLRVDRPERIIAEVLDAQGRVVASVFAGAMPAGVAFPLPLDVRGFAAGVYVVRVRGETFEDSRRMVVIR